MRAWSGSLVLGLALAGCATPVPVPDLTVPLPPVRPSETEISTEGGAQHLLVGAAPLANWWRAFDSRKLDALVQLAFAHNSDLATAEANLRQAAQLAQATAGGQGPQADLNYQVERAKVSQSLATPLADASILDYTLHTAQLTVTYPVDLFGGGRSKVRSARAATAAAAQRLRAARTTVIANLVVAVIQHAALQAEIASQRDAIDANQQLVTLIRRRQMLGENGAIDVAAQEATLASVQAALPPLERQQAHQAGLIASLTGIPAGTAMASLPTLDELRLPTELPLALPADIVANRPDVQAAAAQLRGAAADVGTAVAARLPAIVLTGSLGGVATRLADLFANGNTFYTLLGGVTQPLFHSGQLRHQQRAAEAALASAGAQYRAAALLAFLDVDDALAGLRTDATALDAANRADLAARQTFVFARRQVQLGAIGTFGLLTPASAAAQAAVQHIQARAARTQRHRRAVSGLRHTHRPGRAEALTKGWLRIRRRWPCRISRQHLTR